MFVVVVDIEVLPGSEAAFMTQMRIQARNSLERETGCLRFDICVADEDGRAILLYEVYEDQAAFASHLESMHFREFDVAVQPLMAGKSARTFALEAV